jgi:hypothetical protein
MEADTNTIMETVGKAPAEPELQLELVKLDASINEVCWA